jgi:hypothetical protein
MSNIFLICGILGSTVIVLQFVLMLIGIGHDDGGFGGHDSGGGGHDLGHHGGHDGAGNTIDSTADHHGEHSQSITNWLFGVLTFRALMTFLAFFGLIGMAGLSAELTMLQTIVIAVAAGVGAVFLMQQIYKATNRLRADGTARIDQAVGLPGTVYLGIPGEGRGWGKIQLMLQNRTMEYEASTPTQPLPTGTQIVVTRVVGPDRVEVQAAS